MTKFGDILSIGLVLVFISFAVPLSAEVYSSENSHRVEVENILSTFSEPSTHYIIAFDLKVRKYRERLYSRETLAQIDRLLNDDKYNSERDYVSVIGWSLDIENPSIEDYARYGVKKNGLTIVEPIFDEVIIYSYDIAILKINDLCACFNISSNKLILDFKYRRIDYEEGFLKFYRSSDRFGLYEIENNRIISRCGIYEDYNLKTNSTDYIWAKRGKYFDYINRSTCNVVRLPVVTMAYDTPLGMFGKNEEDVVAIYNAEGYADIFQLRQFVRQSGGYITLHNFTYHIQHVIDINGNILNI